MRFSISNPNGYLFSRTAPSLDLVEVGGDYLVDFKVTVNGYLDSQVEFSLRAVNGTVHLRLDEMLEVLLPRISPSIPNTTTSYNNEVEVLATRSAAYDSALKTVWCFRGGIDGDQADRRWLTWKPQVTRTWLWASEILSFLLPTNVSKTVYAKVYLDTGTSVRVTMGTFNASVSEPRICSVNCSLSRILDFSSVSGNTVLAYDVYATDIPAHRFIVGRERVRVREFLFENSLGVLDTVFATGDVSRETDSNVMKFCREGSQMELFNDAVERFKVNAGGIRERRMMDHWQDFFRSNDRYVLLQGGDVRRIIVDSIEPEMVEHKLSGASVTYHYADKFKGRFHADTEVSAFDYDKYDEIR